MYVSVSLPHDYKPAFAEEWPDCLALPESKDTLNVTHKKTEKRLPCDGDEFIVGLGLTC